MVDYAKHVANIVKPYEAMRIVRGNKPSVFNVIDGQEIIAENVTLEEATKLFGEKQRRASDPEYRGARFRK